MDRLGRWVEVTVGDACDGRSADPDSVLLGLLGAIAQLPAMVRRKDEAALESLVLESLPPLLGFRELVYAVEAGRFEAAHRSEFPA